VNLKILVTALRHPVRYSRALVDRAIYLELVRRTPGVELRGKVRVRGRPIIDVREGARIVLDDGVLLDSDNDGYHVNMHSPVKLLADRAGATILVGRSTRIHGTCVHAYERIEIGARCLIAANTQIMDGSGHALAFDDVQRRQDTRGEVRPVTIGDDVWIGANVIVLPGVTIGDGSVIGAGSVVTDDVPPRSLAAGNPARVVRRGVPPIGP
jgi:acetyltransferase-like isoleucine patch superfamily enzyme